MSRAAGVIFIMLTCLFTLTSVASEGCEYITEEDMRANTNDCDKAIKETADIKDELCNPSLAWTYNDWTHDWTNMTQQMWVDFAGAGYAKMPTEEQWDFIAKNYAIVSLEKCFAQQDYPYTEDAVLAGAKILKKFNPHVAVLYYFNTEICYADCYRYGIEWEAHPEWHLKSDAGSPIYDYPPRRTYYDYTQAAVRAFADFAVTNFTSNKTLLAMLDGVFGDGTTKMPVSSEVNASRLAAWSNWHLYSVNQTRVNMHQTFGSAANGEEEENPPAEEPAPGESKRIPLYVGNSMFFYGQNPTYGMDTEPFVDAICMEHFMAFEMITDQGKLNIDLYHKAIDLAEETTLQRKKPVLVRGFPGPMSGPIDAYGPSFHEKSGLPQPGSNYTLRAQWAKFFLVPSLAGYLIFANERTYFSYNWWYTATDGVYPCPSGQCSAPEGWYPELQKNIGPPLGNYTKEIRVNNVIYKRQFLHANVTFNASNISNSVIDWDRFDDL